VGNTNRRTVVQASLGIKGDLILRISRFFTKKGWGGMTQVEECLPSKLEALSSTSVLPKNNNKNYFRRQRMKMLE
jgi:hypothetical protein